MLLKSVIKLFKFGHLDQGWAGQGFFLRGKVKIFRAGAGRGKARFKIFGAGQGSKSPGRDRAGAGQNVSISADLDHLLKEGKPLFEYNSII